MIDQKFISSIIKCVGGDYHPISRDNDLKSGRQPYVRQLSVTKLVFHEKQFCLIGLINLEVDFHSLLFRCNLFSEAYTFKQGLVILNNYYI